MSYNKLNYLRTSLKRNIKLIRYFGLKFGTMQTFLSVVPRKIRENNKFCIKISEKCSKIAMDYLKEHYLHIIKEYDFRKDKGVIGEQSNIWVFWWQGIENAPEIVRTCVNSIKRNAGNHQIVVLDKSNYQQYVTFPDYILEKFRAGKITITHFSDLLRATLLYEYGGIWMDATLYMLHPLDRQIEKRVFYTINFNGSKKSNVKTDQWTAFFLASAKQNSMIGLLQRLFFEYWKNEEELIVYLLIDYFLTLIYENVEEARQVMDAVPVSNLHIFELDKIINQDCAQLDTLDKDTYMFKLTYKKKFQNFIDGKQTIYNYLVKEH